MSLSDWFRPRPPMGLPDSVKDSTEDWTAGDIAISVGVNGAWTNLDTGDREHGPAKGAMCKVTKVSIHEGRQFLALAGYGDDNVYAAAHFKKLRGEDGWLERAMKRHRPRIRAKEIERVG